MTVTCMRKRGEVTVISRHLQLIHRADVCTFCSFKNGDPVRAVRVLRLAHSGYALYIMQSEQ